MSRILIPVDGSENALHAVSHVLKNLAAWHPLELHILNVQIPIASGNVRTFIDSGTIKRYYLEESELAFAKAKALLDEAAVSYSAHNRVGRIAETIIAVAKELKCDQIVMGTRGLGATSGFWLGSVTTKILHLADVPVTVVGSRA